MFRDYARSMHAKIPKDEPNLLKFSISLGRIEQWCEHHYPSFLVIQNNQGKAATVVDSTTTDARAKFYLSLVDKARQKEADARKAAFLQDLRDRGIIKPANATEDETLAFEEKMKQIAPADEIPWKLIIAVIVGVLVIFGGLTGLVIWVVTIYAEVGWHWVDV